MKTSTTSVAVAAATASVVIACLSSPAYAFVFRSTVKGVQVSPMNVNNRESAPVKLSRPQLSLNTRSRRVLSAGRRRCTSLLSGITCVALGLGTSLFLCLRFYDSCSSMRLLVWGLLVYGVCCGSRGRRLCSILGTALRSVQQTIVVCSSALCYYYKTAGVSVNCGRMSIS